MKKRFFIILGLLLISSFSLGIENMLTPEYYLSEENSTFKEEVDKFISTVLALDFNHPLRNPEGEIPNYSTGRVFGAEIGPENALQHHPAIDLYFINQNASVNMYALHDGVVNTYTDAPKYREYLSITKEIVDINGTCLGRLVTIYAHLDLELDSLDNISLEGKYIIRGDLVSKNLYSGTVGGPHLHFEIRFYRADDDGDEEFYGYNNGSNGLTEPSAGNWLHGYWHPDIGYGFGNPEYFFQNDLSLSDGEISQKNYNILENYPNPYNSYTTIRFILEQSQKVNLSILNNKGELVKLLTTGNLESGTHSILFNSHNLSTGIYYCKLLVNDRLYTKRITFLK